MKYEDIIEDTGGCGFYQKWILSVLYLAVVIDGFHAAILILLVPNTKHRCSIPGWSNDTYEVQNERHKEAIDRFIPQYMNDGELEYNNCYMYGQRGDNTTRHKCNSWVYDKSTFQTTITSDMNLVCDRKEFKTYFLISFFLGAFAATISCGWLSDRFGRKPIIIITLITQGISGITLSQMTRMEAIFILRFLASWGGSGVYIPTAVFGTEMASTSRRTSASVALHVFFTFGSMLLALLAYYIRTWRLLILLISVPTLPLAIIYIWILPESPRWLLSIHKHQKADKIFYKMAKMNKRKLPVYPREEIQILSPPTSRTVKLWKMFTVPSLLKRTLINMFTWTAVNFVYHGLALNVSNLSGNIYLNIILNVTPEIPGYLLCLVLLNRIGRKKLYTGFMIIASMLGIAAIFPFLYASKDLGWIVTILSALTRLCIAGCFGIIYLLTCELYPTVIRNGALGTLSTCARIGGLVSPYILKSTTLIPGKIGKSLPMVLMGVVCFTSGALVTLLPETSNQDLQENFDELYIEEEEEKKRNQVESRNIPLFIKNTSDNGNSENSHKYQDNKQEIHLPKL